MVLILHGLVVLGLVRAFAPDLGATLIGSATQAFDIPLAPEPTPPPAPTAEAAPKPQGAAAPEGRKAVPREVAAPRPKVVLTKAAAPPVAATGHADSAGARDRGAGTGAGGSGEGTGSGGTGSGPGGGGQAQRAVKVAGDINSARDYPKETRALRLGGAVVVALTIDVSGRVKDCRVLRASRDAEADRITCRLATERFRFRPAVDQAGRPVESIYGWQQRWFAPRED